MVTGATHTNGACHLVCFDPVWNFCHPSFRPWPFCRFLLFRSFSVAIGIDKIALEFLYAFLCAGFVFRAICSVFMRVFFSFGSGFSAMSFRGKFVLGCSWSITPRSRHCCTLVFSPFLVELKSFFPFHKGPLFVDNFRESTSSLGLVHFDFFDPWDLSMISRDFWPSIWKLHCGHAMFWTKICAKS